jgi:2-amino-4,5-dihydroxy-6-oxo-7-(phosphonooxy)heptanoate synthase
VSNAFARDLRVARLFRRDGRRLMVVPLDHSVTDGPISRTPDGLNRLIRQLAASAVDAVVLHKGSLRLVDHRSFVGTSLIVHLSPSTVHAPDPDAKYMVATVPEALRLGADAVSVHLNLGSTQEATQIADLATVADACDAWNMPLVVMAYPRGPRIENPRDPELVAHAATVSVDLGADIVKLPYVGSVAAMGDVIRACPVPVIVAGGPRLEAASQVLGYVDQILRTGAAGLAMGRNIFQASDPGGLARRIVERVHHGRVDRAVGDGAERTDQLEVIPA